MNTLSVSIPEDIKDVMDEFKSVDWSAIAREAVWEKARQLAFLKYFASESELTEQDAINLGRKVNESMYKKYKEKYSELL